MQLRFALFIAASMPLAAVPRLAEARELAYRAGSGCPSHDEVAAKIEDVASAGPPVRIDVVQDGASVRGDVVVGGVSRRLSARSCGAVVDALVLVVALADEPVHEHAEEPEAMPPAAPPVPVRASQPEADRPIDVAPAHASVQIVLGAAADATSYGGHVLPGGSLFGEVGAFGAFGIAWLRPSLRGGVMHTLRSSITTDDLELSSTTGMLDVCPLGIGREGARIVSSFCAHGELGAIEIRGGDGGPTTGRPWTRIGGLARTRIEVGELASLRGFVEASTGLFAPLTRYRFPGWLGDVPQSQWTVALGGGVVLP